jgi:RimJ/RimL family protein N-acetyltransferase
MLPPIRTLETERLWLKPLAMSDARAIQRRFPHWEIVRLLNGKVPWPYPPDGAEQYLKRKVEKQAPIESYAWGLWLKTGEPDEVIGTIELRPSATMKEDARGFWLSREFWGQGLMTEAADRVLDFAFDDCGMSEIILSNATPNVRSGAVKVRQGATLIGEDTIETVSGVHPRQLWRITAEDWRKRRSGRTNAP